MCRRFARTLAITCVVAMAMACQPEGPVEADLYGVWRGEHADHRLTFTFRDDKTCELHFENTDSNELTVWKGRFETDFTKKPIALSIRNIPSLTHPLHTIVRFDTDGITLAPFAPRWRLRPISFNPEHSMTLARSTTPS